MASFKLLAGQHIATDPDAKPLTPEQIKAGARLPSRTYAVGETIVSDDDLVARFGPDKFERIGGGEVQTVAPLPTSSAPGGQVSSGFQSATGTPSGTVSGPSPAPEPPAHTPHAHGPHRQQGPHSPELERMSMPQLQALAEQEEVDLKDARSKEAMIRALRAARPNLK